MISKSHSPLHHLSPHSPSPSSHPFLFLFGANLSCANDGQGLLDKIAVDSRKSVCVCLGLLWVNPVLGSLAFQWLCAGTWQAWERPTRAPPQHPVTQAWNSYVTPASCKVVPGPLGI